jgi:alpha-N-arabinofuranosidase
MIPSQGVEAASNLASVLVLVIAQGWCNHSLLMRRRNFLKTASVASAAILLRDVHGFAAGTECRIDVLLNEPLGTISPNVYGHFAEQLGGVIYDGVWVGESSKIPNQYGIRTALVDKLRQIKAPMIRWPGGCFADSYDWMDGVGQRSARPSRAGFWRDEPNIFGTPDFMRLCQQSGAQPYLAANVRSLPAQGFDHWIEYCNAPAGKNSLAKLRESDGFRDPFNVQYWGIGNESWGCGGNMKPEEYSALFRRFAAWTPQFGSPLKFVASGPGSDDEDWTRQFFANTFSGKRAIQPKSVFGWSLHHYSWDLARGKTHNWEAAKGDALNFDAADWYELFQQGQQLETAIRAHWAIMGEYDHEHHVKLVIDEYGPWYKPGTELEPSDSLGQQVTLRDALLTAFTLDVFNRHPEKVSIGACAQLVNCLNALFFAHQDKFTVTPNFYVFDMYSSHQGGQAVRTEFSAPEVQYDRDGKPARFWGLQGSASIDGRHLTLTVVNPSVDQARETEIVLRSARAASVHATVLTNADIHAHNTFEDPNHVTTIQRAVSPGDKLVFTFPAASVTKMAVTMA